MDYIEAFKNLRTNKKWGRKSPHKAVMMLAVLELYERNILTENEIFYDDELKSMFLQVWNKVMLNEPLFHPDAYLPFWYLQSDNFWHIIPRKGKEYILTIMRDNNVKPTEAKLCDSVKYAEMDEDLYFMMTIPSGRSSLKRALLETYFDFSEMEIEKLSESKDNSIDYSASALYEYEQMLSNKSNEMDTGVIAKDGNIVDLNKLDEELQITIYYVYYSFLKKHREERLVFKDICPSVSALYDNIVNPTHVLADFTTSSVSVFEKFLSDLKFSLMSENNSMELIQKIEDAIDCLHKSNGVDIHINGDDSDQGDMTADLCFEEQLFNPSSVETEIDKQELFPSNYGDKGVLNSTKPEEYVVPEEAYEKEKAMESQDDLLHKDVPKAAKRKSRRWSLKDEKDLIIYYQAGMTIQQLAQFFEKDEDALKAKLTLKGLIV